MNPEPAVPPEMGAPKPSKAWPESLAYGSLALGVLSFVTLFWGFFQGPPAIRLILLLGALAIVVGVAARLSLLPAKRNSLSGLIATAGITLGTLIVTLLIWAWAFSHEDSHYRKTCQNNLLQFRTIMRMYAEENDGRLPDTLFAFYPEYLSDVSIGVCPQSGHKPGDPARIDAWGDYAYVPGLHVTNTPADADVLVCYDKEYTYHEGRGRNELYLDGHVVFHLLGQPHQPASANRP